MNPQRCEVWLFDPGREGKVRPALPVGIPFSDLAARATAHADVRACFESLRKDNRPIPLDRPALREELLATLPESA
jgi:hypothetical protein